MCSVCGGETDPYSPKAVHVRVLNPLGVMLTVSLTALLPGLGLGFVIVTVPWFLFVVLPLLIPACWATDRARRKSASRQRIVINAAVAVGWALGIGVGISTLAIVVFS